MAFPPPPASPGAVPPQNVSGPRRASFPRDVPSITELVELCFAGKLDYSSRYVLRNVRWIAQRGAVVWKLSFLLGSVNPEEWILASVWEETGKVVGNVTLTLRKREKGAWLMSNVAVHPDFRRQGVGRGLVRFALEEIRARGGQAVYLQVDAQNETAVRLYHELGFEEIGRRITWTRMPGSTSRGATADGCDPAYRIAPRRAAEWREEYGLWKAISPAGFAWNTPLFEGIFHPPAAIRLERMVFGESEEHFLARRGERLEAALCAVHRLSGWEGFLMQIEGTGGRVERALWNEAWKGGSPATHCLLETVPESSETVLEELGFQKHRTFVWMRYTMEGGGP
jgi:ribosomal protein S18 acetylase RimI-like enzyme